MWSIWIDTTKAETYNEYESGHKTYQNSPECMEGWVRLFVMLLLIRMLCSGIEELAKRYEKIYFNRSNGMIKAQCPKGLVL